MVCHDDVPMLPSKGSKKQSLCLKYGMCVHQGKGRLAFMLRNAFLRYLKARLPRQDLEVKQQLLTGRFCISLHRAEAVERAVSSWAELVEEEAAEEQDHRPAAGPAASDCSNVDVIHLHLALQYLKPYRPTFQRLEFVGQEAFNRVRLRQTGVFLGELEFWRALGSSRPWSASVSRTLETKAPVAVLAPADCIVEQLDTEPSTFWRGPPRPRRRRAQRQEAAVDAPSNTSPTATTEPLACSVASCIAVSAARVLSTLATCLLAVQLLSQASS